MKAFVAVSKNKDDEHIAMLIPLYADRSDEIDSIEGYSISFSVRDAEPMAFIVQDADDAAVVVTATAVYNNLEIIGEL